MTIFDEIKIINKRIYGIEDKLAYLQLQACSPKSPIYSDMPRGSGITSNPVEEYAIKRETLNEKLTELRAERNSLWERIKNQMQYAGISKQAMELMRLRYYMDFTWEICVEKMQRVYSKDNWNANKCFRIHREVLNKVN